MDMTIVGFLLYCFGRMIQVLFSVHQEIPDGNWYCINCTCRICGNLVNDKEALDAHGSLQCSQCEHKCKFDLHVQLFTFHNRSYV